MAVTQAYSFADLFAFTRATAGWSFDAAGALVESAAGSVRADYDPATLAWRGLLIEPPTTNLHPNPRMEGWAAGSPGTVWPSSGYISPTGSGLTRTLTTGVENGIAWVGYRWAGTATAAVQLYVPLGSSTPVAAIAGDTVTLSAFIDVRGTALPAAGAVMRVNEQGASAYTASDVKLQAGGLSLAGSRQSVTRLFTNASTTGATCLAVASVANGETVDFTIRVGCPQIEKSPCATSPILPPIGTPGASARNADTLSMTSIARWFNPVAGTFVMDFMPGQAATPAYRDLLMIDDGTSANRLRLRMLLGDTTVRLGVTNGGVGSAALNAASGAALVRHTARFSYGPAGHFLSVNGAAPVSHTDAVPGGLTRVLIGNSGGSNYLNGWIGPRLDYFPTQYTDTAAADGFTIRTR